MTQPDHDPDDNDVRDASITDTTRRGALAALGLGGLAALGSGHATADLAGGPESDAMSEHRVPLYRVPEPDLDSPGVVGRRVEITAGGSTYAAGDQLVDTGSSWERISPGYDSLNTEDLFTETLPADAYVYKHGSSVYAAASDTSVGLIDSGSDASTVIQSAVDQHTDSTVYIASSTYDISSTITISSKDELVGGGWTTVLNATADINVVEATSDTKEWAVRNLKFDTSGTNATGFRGTNVESGRIDSCRFDHDQSGNTAKAIDFSGRSSVSFGTGPVVTNCLIRDYAGAAGIYINNNPQYGIVSNNRIMFCQVGVRVQGGNWTVGNNRIVKSFDAAIKIVNDSNDGKVGVVNNRLNHNQNGNGYGIVIEDARLVLAANNHILVNDGHGIYLNGAHECGVYNNNIGNIGDGSGEDNAIQLEDNNDTNQRNVIVGNFSGSYKVSDMTYAINEVSGVSGNVIRLNQTIKSSGFSLNSTAASLNDVI